MGTPESSPLSPHYGVRVVVVENDVHQGTGENEVDNGDSDNDAKDDDDDSKDVDSKDGNADGKDRK